MSEINKDWQIADLQVKLAEAKTTPKTQAEEIERFKTWLEDCLELDGNRLHPAKIAFENIFNIKLKGGEG